MKTASRRSAFAATLGSNRKAKSFGWSIGAYLSRFTEFPEDVYTRWRPRKIGSSFDLDTAATLGWAAQLAYEFRDHEKQKNILKAWGWTLHDFCAGRISTALPLTSSNGYVAESAGVRILAFSGTDPVSLSDWIVDFNFHKDPAGLHDGFKDGVGAVWDAILPLLGPAATDRLVICGHSLGAALAAVAAYRLIDERVVGPDRLLGVYAYGMPRCGNGQFADAYRAIADGALARKTFRTINGDDIVPLVPPTESPFNYCHVGSSLTCAHGARFDAAALIANPPDPAPSSRSGVLDALKDLLHRQASPGFPGDRLAAVVIDALPPAIRDHLMDRYLRALGAL
jgi:triacylglycerol lipase